MDAGLGARVGGGRKQSEARGWSGERQAYEVGLVIEEIVRQLELDEVGVWSGVVETLRHANPFLLPSLPSMPLPCRCACCQGLPCQRPCATGCKDVRVNAREFC
eukprot:COSAG02_NODE_2130_length_9732_cov_4.306031_7_plen_104_part_00